MKNWHRLSALELTAEYKKGSFSLESLVKSTIARIDALNPDVGAFVALHRERSLKRAIAIDQKRGQGLPLGKLAGVIIGIKDNIHIEGELTTCASTFLVNYRAPFSATVTELLEAEDAILIGKLNMDEFAMGSSTETSSYGICRNPWDLNCVPGGSSGGSAAAVAARFCTISLGSDTGGSIRQPAAFCGVVGFKPSYGLVSRYGLAAFASSLDQIGPCSTCVAESALTMDVLSKYCPRDATSSPLPREEYSSRLNDSIAGKTIGVPWHFLEGLSGETRKNFEESIELFKNLGAKVIEIDLDVLKYSLAIYYIIATAEAAANLAKFDGIRYGVRSEKATTLDEVYKLSRQEGFGFEVRNRILLGTYVLCAGYKDAHYKKAKKARTLITQKYKEAFMQCDVIAMPTAPTPAFEIGKIQNPLQMYLQDIYTISINLAGLPGISIPSGFSESAEGKKLPFGLQLVGKPMRDGDLFAFASAFEKSCTASCKIPKAFDCEVTS